MILWLWAPTPSWGYRPFISTDAAVVGPKEIEIELGYFTLERDQGDTSFIIPQAVINYGVFKNWEAVVEFAVQRSRDAELNVIDAGVFGKGVLKEGVLQDKQGISLAVEGGLLLPSTERGQRRFGFEGVGILSDTVGAFTFHINGGLGVERSTGDVVGIWGVIGELPVAPGLRLVGEVNGEKPRREGQRDSVLLGLIWQPWTSRSVWLDAGVRRGFTNGAADWQFILGVTVDFSAASLRQGLSSAGELRSVSRVNGLR